ncbi:MAG: ABC transporter permease subunit [Ignavibacteriales bacterium]|nr:ABC transporter permease subunit [Ignavibacteriales bacterium]
MLSTIITHELKNIFFSPKFSVTFIVVSLLLILSVIVGIDQYQKAIRQYETTTQLVQQEMREARGWMSLNNKILRKPDPMQIFVAGVNNDVGRISGISSFFAVKLSHSTFSDDPIYAVFRFVDFAFIVTVVFSLLAILFTYDAINGEAEKGTLQLTFANAVPRAQYIVGKFVGSWLGLIIPLAVPMLISLLLLLLWNVPLQSEEWLKIVSLFAAALLYVTFFISLGIFLSTMTKRSSVSFLFSLVTWVCMVFIIPRAGATVAGHIITVPTVAEIEAQREAFSKDRWTEYEGTMQEKWKARNAPTQTMTKQEREAFRDSKMWEWMEEDDRDRKQVQVDIDEQAKKLNEDLRNRKAEQEYLAFVLSRFSPASAFQLAAMNLAGTDIALKSRYEDALNEYRPVFNTYKDKKQKETGNSGGFRIEVNSDTGVKIDAGREKGVLDISEMPQFTHPKHTFSDAMASAVIDFGLLGFFSLTTFAGAFVRFLRYDVR